MSQVRVIFIFYSFRKTKTAFALNSLNNSTIIYTQLDLKIATEFVSIDQNFVKNLIVAYKHNSSGYDLLK